MKKHKCINITQYQSAHNIFFAIDVLELFRCLLRAIRTSIVNDNHLKLASTATQTQHHSLPIFICRPVQNHEFGAGKVSLTITPYIGPISSHHRCHERLQWPHWHQIWSDQVWRVRVTVSDHMPVWPLRSFTTPFLHGNCQIVTFPEFPDRISQKTQHLG